MTMRYCPKVLVFAPISKIKHYCMHEWIHHIQNLSYPNYEILLVDNSEDPKYHQELKAAYPNIKFKYVNPKGERSQEFIAFSQYRAQVYLLKGDYEYGMSIECDVFPPHDCIQRLMRHKKKVAMGIYSWHIGENRRPLIQMAEKFNTRLRTRNVSYEEGLLFMDGKLKPALGAGVGCALMHRSILRRVRFSSIKDNDAHSDTFFYLDAYRENADVYADTSLFCKHKNQSWGYQILVSDFSKK